ncbi:MAG: acyltransferase [Methylococcales bacterium]|nr:acyltransferase [Methylococcaceae bacterium]
MEKNHFFRVFEGLRCIAALGVVGYHATYGWPGYLAVEVFMLLSGFILAHTCLDRSYRVNGSTFILQRLARMYPMHIFGLMAYVFAYWLNHDKHWPSFPDGTLFTLLQQLTLLHNVGFNPNGLTWNFPAWCVSIEIWINVIVFFALPMRMKSAYLLLIALASYLVLFNHSHRLGVHYELYWGWLASGMVRGFADFMLGWFVYRVYSKWSAIHRISMTNATIIELLLVGLIAPIFWFKLQDGASDFIAVGLMALFLLVLALERGFVSKILSVPVAVYFGRISYSMFLLHIPILEFFYYLEWHAVTLGLPLFLTLFLSTVIVIGSLTYYRVEEPCRRFLKQYQPNPSH